MGPGVHEQSDDEPGRQEQGNVLLAAPVDEPGLVQLAQVVRDRRRGQPQPLGQFLAAGGLIQQRGDVHLSRIIRPTSSGPRRRAETEPA